MVDVNMDLVRELRSLTELPLKDIVAAVRAAGNDRAKALSFMKEAARRRPPLDRPTSFGTVGMYVHPDHNRAALVLVACETDFVARSDPFRALAHELALQACATSAQTVLELLTQPYVKDPDRQTQDLVQEVMARLRENLQVVDVKTMKV